MSYRLNTPFKERCLQFCTFKTKPWPILLLLLFISKKWENVLFLKDYNVTYVYHGDARLCYLIKFTEIDNKKPKYVFIISKTGGLFFTSEKLQSTVDCTNATSYITKYIELNS